MIFEEAIDKIILHQEEEYRNPGAYVSYDGLGAMVDILRELEATYAPKIKMPQKIMLVFMEMKFNYQVDFEFFWKLMGDCVATDYLRENYKEEEIMQAWLHPELIEVEE